MNRYAPEACVRDIMDACAALHIHQAILIGTSFGGLLSMGLAAVRPGLVRAVVLNDIGPDIGTEGAEFVRDFVGQDPALESLDACVTFLQGDLPPMSLNTDAGWRRMAELTYAPGPDGRWHPLWDTRIARLLDAPTPDLWTLFGALAHVPVLLIRGAVSNILLPGTVSRMQAIRPDMAVVSPPRYRSCADPDRTSGLGRHQAVARTGSRTAVGGSMRLARFVAAGFGTGYSPVAAGTVASAAAALTGAGLLHLSPLALLAAALLATVGGMVAVKRAGVEGDPGWVVIDEFAGQWISLMALARPTVAGVIAAFVLFRLFDVTKLGPVGWADRQHGAFGIMADDVIAGIIAALVLVLVRLLRPQWLM